MSEGMQKKNLDTSADETRTFDYGVIRSLVLVTSRSHGWSYNPDGSGRRP